MSVYELLDESNVATYVRGRPELASRIDASSLIAREVGDGNLNLVFVCRDATGRSMVLKQSLPYVRAAGPSWPLTADRSHAEAIGLRAAFDASPRTSVEPFAYDASNHVLAMEDLSHLIVWRAALNEGHAAADAAVHCGQHIARLFFATGTLGLASEEYRRAAADSTNLALCRITEDLVFTDPFVDNERNVIDEGLENVVDHIRRDPAVRTEVGRLKAEFMTRAEALVHGDLHTGSVMVSSAGCQAKVIDPEFCFYGPIAFDLGVLVANLLFAHARAVTLDRHEHARSIAQLPRACWDSFEATLWDRWPHRVEPSFTDDYATMLLQRIKYDALGFGGCEAVRRIVGFAKVSDIATLEPDQRVAASSIVLETAHRWLATSNVGWSDCLSIDLGRVTPEAAGR